MTCPQCGEELDDYGPCFCQIEVRPPKKNTHWNMRTMVAAKLARKAQEKEKR